MATDAEVEAAAKAMRAIRTRGGEVHDEVLRAYARAALRAVELLQLEEYRKRAELLRRQAELVAADAHQVATGHSDAH
jgi:predicted nucleic acid-binding protein